MSDDKILDQDEIDALIHGVDLGKVDTTPEAAPGDARADAARWGACTAAPCRSCSAA